MHPRAVKVLEFSQGVRGKHQGRCGWCEECEFFFQTHWSVLYFSLPKWVCLVLTKPDFGHPRAKLISPTHKMCSSVLASKKAKRIQRNVCLAIPARTRQEGKKQNAKASKKKKFATVAVLCRSTLTFMFLQSWMSHGSMTGLMTGVVFS